MSNLPPAASLGPGRHLSPEAKREVQAARNVQGSVSEIMQARKARRKPRIIDRLPGDFRDAHHVLRKSNGRFAEETTPKHKRPKRIPWEKKK